MKRIFIPVITMVLLSAVSCRYSTHKRITGDGVSTSEQRSAGTFHSVEVSGPFKVRLTQGATTSIEVNADRNMMSYIQTENDNGTLQIKAKRGYNLRFKTPVEIFITSSDYRNLSITGSGDIMTGVITTERINADVRGSGDIFLEADAPEIETKISGSGNIQLKGKARDLRSDIRGSGELHAFNLLTENTEIDIKGSGDAEVFASKNLDIEIGGSGNVRYKGDPTVKRSVRGSGDINKAD